MTTLHFVRRARKARPEHGIRKGMSFFWWQFAYGEKQYSLTKPRRSQYATRSDFLREMYDVEDEVNALAGDPADVIDALGEFADRVAALGDDANDRLENNRAAFPGSNKIELLENRVDACRDLANELREAANQLSDDSTADDVQSALGTIGWDYE